MSNILVKQPSREVTDFILRTQLELRLNTHNRTCNLSQTVLHIIKEYIKIIDKKEK